MATVSLPAISLDCSLVGVASQRPEFRLDGRAPLLGDLEALENLLVFALPVHGEHPLDLQIWECEIEVAQDAHEEHRLRAVRPTLRVEVGGTLPDIRKTLLSGVPDRPPTGQRPVA